MNAPLVVDRGRFLIDARPEPSPLAASGYLYRWTVLDFDDEQQHSGLAADLGCAWTESVTLINELRRPRLEVVPELVDDYPTRAPLDDIVPGPSMYRAKPTRCFRCDRSTHFPVPWFGAGEQADPNLDVLVCVRCHPSFSAECTSEPARRLWADLHAEREVAAL